MKIAFLASRKGYLKVMGSLIQAAIDRGHEALLVGQVALALALTLGAGLLVRSYLALQRVEPGFDPSNVLAVPFGRCRLRLQRGDR